jgi:cystathionine beta-lyase/cystathionine gamma-synthase
MSKKKFKGISTTTLHTANHENDNFSHTTPIYATSTFTFDSTDEGMERFKKTGNVSSLKPEEDKETNLAKTVVSDNVETLNNPNRPRVSYAQA